MPNMWGNSPSKVFSNPCQRFKCCRVARAGHLTLDPRVCVPVPSLVLTHLWIRFSALSMLCPTATIEDTPANHGHEGKSMDVSTTAEKQIYYPETDGKPMAETDVH